MTSPAQNAVARYIKSGDVIAITKNGEIYYKTVNNVTEDDYLCLSTSEELQEELGQDINQNNAWLVNLRQAKKRGEM